MRLANVDGRLAIHGGAEIWHDVALASGGRFGPDPMSAYEDWPGLAEWARGARPDAPVSAGEIGAVVPNPKQIFAVGLNYHDHTQETGFVQPEHPLIFTKYASCLCGPEGTIAMPSDTVDWEVELVTVIGARAYQVSRADALGYVAGFTIGQDFSDRATQMRGNPAQFGLGKSYPNFGPLGPYLATADELPALESLRLTCTVNGELMQEGHVSDMVFDIPALICYLSSVCPLEPGDLVFTGTPSGVGMGRQPTRYLKSGDRVVTEITGLGRMEHVMTEAGR